MFGQVELVMRGVGVGFVDTQVQHKCRARKTHGVEFSVGVWTTLFGRQYVVECVAKVSIGNHNLCGHFGAILQTDATDTILRGEHTCDWRIVVNGHA